MFVKSSSEKLFLFILAANIYLKSDLVTLVVVDVVKKSCKPTQKPSKS